MERSSWSESELKSSHSSVLGKGLGVDFYHNLFLSNQNSFQMSNQCGPATHYQHFKHFVFRLVYFLTDIKSKSAAHKYEDLDAAEHELTDNETDA